MEDQNLKRMQLLAKAQQGDAESASQLYLLCCKDLYFYAYQVLGKKSQAESTVCETLVKMCSQKSTPNNPAQFVPWMLYFCHLVCRKYLSQSTNQPDLGGMLENDVVLAVVDNSGILSEETRNQMSIAIKNMPMEERAVMTLVYYENLPVEHAAMICGWKPQIAEAFRSSGMRTLKAVAARDSKAMGYVPKNVSLKSTITCVMASLQKEYTFTGALSTYWDFCTSLRIMVSHEIEEALGAKKEVVTASSQPVVFNDAVYKKEPFWRSLSKPIKTCIICFAFVLVGVGVFLGLYKFKPELFASNEPEESTVSVVEDPFKQDSDTTKAKKTSKTYATDENGKEIRPTIKVAKRTTKKVADSGKVNNKEKPVNGNAGGALDGKVTKFATQKVTRPKTTTKAKSQGNNQQNSAGNDTPQNYTTKKVITRATYPENQTAYRPAVATTAAGSVSSSGESNGLKYQIHSNGTAYVTGYTGSGAVNVPSTLGGKTVAAIADSAFAGNTRITSITLPASVSFIGDKAFDGCTSLKSVNMGSGLVSVGLCSFRGCTSLSSISWSSRLTRIGNSAFKNCKALTSVSLPSSVNCIEGSAFNGCSSITSMKLTSNLRCIEAGTFNGCKNMTSVELYSGLQYIDVGSFSGCNSLSTIIFHGSSAQWHAIPADIDMSNRPLDSATIVYK